MVTIPATSMLVVRHAAMRHFWRLSSGSVDLDHVRVLLALDDGDCKRGAIMSGALDWVRFAHAARGSDPIQPASRLNVPVRPLQTWTAEGTMFSLIGVRSIWS
jgi:hypothetical protein